jgi:hypothetical protein
MWICPNCAASAEDTVAVCPGCGAARPTVVNPPAIDSAAEQPAEPSEEADWSQTAEKIADQAKDVSDPSRWSGTWCRVGFFVGVLGCLLTAFFAYLDKPDNRPWVLLGILPATVFCSVLLALICCVAGFLAEAIYRSITGPPKEATRLLQKLQAKAKKRRKRRKRRTPNTLPPDGITPKEDRRRDEFYA